MPGGVCVVDDVAVGWRGVPWLHSLAQHVCESHKGIESDTVASCGVPFSHRPCAVTPRKPRRPLWQSPHARSPANARANTPQSPESVWRGTPSGCSRGHSEARGEDPGGREMSETSLQSVIDVSKMKARYGQHATRGMPSPSPSAKHCQHAWPSTALLTPHCHPHITHPTPPHPTPHRHSPPALPTRRPPTAPGPPSPHRPSSPPSPETAASYQLNRPSPAPNARRGGWVQ